jgi:hypothetical protein
MFRGYDRQMSRRVLWLWQQASAGNYILLLLAEVRILQSVDLAGSPGEAHCRAKVCTQTTDDEYAEKEDA